VESSKETAGANFSSSLVTAVVIGFIVTLLQTTCTSQVYLPTILFVMNIPSLRSSAATYLILYNAVILPRCDHLWDRYGESSEHLALFLQKRAATIKLITPCSFFVGRDPDWTFYLSGL